MSEGLGKIENKSVLDMAKELIKELDIERLHEQDFINENLLWYSARDIKKDLHDTAVMQKNDYYESSGHKSSPEDILIEEGFEASTRKAFQELFNNAKVLAPTKSDDRNFGIDTIVLEQKDKEPSAFGITLDVTTSQKFENIKKKVDRNFQNSISNNFRQPKYVLRNTKLEDQPKLPVGVFACSKENAVKFIKATYEHDVKVESEFFALFLYQYKLFLQKARETADMLVESDDYDIKKKAIQSNLILIEVASFIENNIDRNLVAKDVPLYLQADKSNKILEDLLNVKGEFISAQYALEKKLTKK